MSALAPRLRHRITFQEQVQARDSEGAVSVVWQNATVGERELVDVPSEVLTGGGREFNASGQVQAEVAARVTLRWFNGLSPTWRILWDGQVFNIAGIETDITGRREYRLRCMAGVNDGQ